MSDVKKVELRRAAEAAPKGEWDFDRAAAERHFCAQVWDSEGKNLAVLAATEVGSCAAQYIAAANPSVVLSLLDEHDALLAERDQLRAELDAIRGQQAATALELRKASSWICREVEAGTTSATHWAIRLRERADQIESGTSQQPDAVSVPRELDALRKDAERWRFVREKQTFIWLVQDWIPGDAEFTDVDAAVDSAMQEVALSTRQAEEGEPCAK